MRCALLLAAWASTLAVAQPALDPWLQALYGRRRPPKKDVRASLLQVAGDDYAAAVGGAPYEYGGDLGRAPPSSLLRRFFQRADLEDDYEDERTTLYCITVKPKPQTTPSTTPEVICFPPSRRRPKKTRSTTPLGNCEDVPRKNSTTTAAPKSWQATKLERTTVSRKHHSSSQTRSSRRSTPRPTSARTKARSPPRTTSRTSRRTSRTTRSAHRTRHVPTVGECAVDVFVTAAASSKATQGATTRSTTPTTRATRKTSKSKTTQRPKTTRRRTTARATSRTTRSTQPRTKSKKQDSKWCPVGAEPATTTTTARTRPPVDEFLAAWGYFRHRNSLDPRNGSHWREFHDDAGGARTLRRRHLGEPAGPLLVLPPWVRRRPPGQPVDQRLSKRDGRLASAAPGPYRLFWFGSWPPAGGEVSRLPARDKDNFVKLASWWQDVMRTYNGHQRKKRAAQPSP